MVPVTDDKMCGKFFGGDSYVIRYSYQNSEGRDAYIVYYWQVELTNYIVRTRVKHKMFSNGVDITTFLIDKGQ